MCTAILHGSHVTLCHDSAGKCRVDLDCLFMTMTCTGMLLDSWIRMRHGQHYLWGCRISALQRACSHDLSIDVTTQNYQPASSTANFEAHVSTVLMPRGT